MAATFKYYDPSIELVKNDTVLLSKLHTIRETGFVNNKSVVGAVRIFKNGKVCQDVTPNLVVGLGRQYIAQRIFGLAHPAETEIGTNPVWDWKITHFAFGNGGAATIGDYTNLLGPDSCDRDLYNAIPLSKTDTSYLTTPGDHQRSIAPVQYAVKSILPAGTIDIVAADDLNCSQGKIYSYVRVVCTKFPGEPDYLDDGDDYLNINEAALYYTNGVDKVRMFSHICFPAKYVEKQSEFIVEWYIMC